MRDAQGKSDWPILVALFAAVVLVAPGLYGGGYCALTKAYTSVPDGPERVRIFDAHWKTQAFYPASLVESFLTGRKVYLVYVTVEDATELIK